MLWRRVDAARPRPAVHASRRAIAADWKIVRPLTATTYRSTLKNKKGFT